METIDQNTHLAEELAEIATELQRSFLVELSTEVNRGNISIPQYTLLGFLNQTSGLNMSQLAELMRHTTPATTGLVERLVEAGLIERFSHPKDRRQVLVRITDKGRELVEGLKRGIVRNLQELFKDLSQEDIEAWLRIYRTIIRPVMFARFSTFTISPSRVIPSMSTGPATVSTYGCPHFPSRAPSCSARCVRKGG